MKYFNTLSGMGASFSAKEHSVKLGNCEECKMFFHIHPTAEILLVTKGDLTIHILGNSEYGKVFPLCPTRQGENPLQST